MASFGLYSLEAPRRRHGRSGPDAGLGLMIVLVAFAVSRWARASAMGDVTLGVG